MYSIIYGYCLIYASAFVLFTEHLRTIHDCGQSHLPISSRTASFLYIAFQRPRVIYVQREAYVGFVNAHTESLGRYHDIGISMKELVLFGKYITTYIVTYTLRTKTCSNGTFNASLFG